MNWCAFFNPTQFFETLKNNSIFDLNSLKTGHISNIEKIGEFVKMESKNLKEILKNGIQGVNQFVVGTKNVLIGAYKHVFGELSVKYVDFM